MTSLDEYTPHSIAMTHQGVFVFRIVCALTLLFSISSFAAKPICGDLTVKAASDPTLKQIAKLNSEIVTEGLSLDKIYLRLREEEAAFSQPSAQLPDNLKNHLRIEFNSRYEVDALSDDELRVFYLNALRSLYGQVAWNYKAAEIEVLIGESVPRNLQELAQNLIDHFISPYNLRDQEMRPESAAQFFRERPWQNFDFKNAFVILKAWQDAGGSEKGFYRFRSWVDTQENLPQLSHQSLEILQLSLSRKAVKVLCCLSSGGCVLCPHNRRFLREN
jgi:hypothetical protein